MIEVYAPTEAVSEYEIDEFYKTVDHAFNMIILVVWHTQLFFYINGWL